MRWISRYDPGRSRAQNAEYVIDHIKKLGFRVNASSRLGLMHRILTTGPEVIDPNDPEFEAALEAERDLQMIGFIIDVIGDRLTHDTFQKRFGAILSDPVLPQQNLAQSDGRDAQFEFYIAAICEKAGMKPVLLEEPDVTCFVKSQKFGIAAKRIKNVAKLETRVLEAAKQIQNSGLPGLVAVDTCVALNRENERVTIPMVDEVFMRIHKKALNEFIKFHHDRIQSWVRAKGVRGVILHDEQIRYLEGNSWCLSGMTIWLETTHFNARRSKEFTAFIEKYRRGIPNAEDM